MPAELPLTYRQNPRPIGFPVTYSLTGERLTVDTLQRVDELNLGTVELVRLTYEPGRFSSGSYRTLLRFRNGRSVSLGSISWSGMLHNTNQIAAYAAFVTAVIGVVGRAMFHLASELGRIDPPPFLDGCRLLIVGR